MTSGAKYHSETTKQRTHTPGIIIDYITTKIKITIPKARNYRIFYILPCFAFRQDEPRFA